MSGSHRTRVTATAMRRNSQRGAELTLVTTGQARHAITTPITVNFE
jgi:hypothetical protein